MSGGITSIAALTVRQREVLGAIAVGQDNGHHPKVLAALEEQGLIVGYPEVLPGYPPVTITRWEVPVAVHIRWCEWCATQPDLEPDPEERL